MLNKSDIIEIKIDSIAYGGEGVGRVNGMAVFIPDTAPNDVVKAELTSVKKSYARAQLKEIIKPSPSRIKALCGLAKVCGGCDFQHILYSEQLKIKKQMILDTFKKIAGFEVEVRDAIGSKNNLEYRCKVQYPVQQTKNSRRFLAGYYQKGSHELVNIKKCHIQPRIIDEITNYLREKSQEYKIPAYYEKRNTGLVRHWVFRYSKTNNKLLLIIVINAKESTIELNNLCVAVKKEFPEIEGVLINYNNAKTNVIMSNHTELMQGKDYIMEELEGRTFKVSSGSFFQINPDAAVSIFNEVYDIVKTYTEKPSLLDVYSGVGTFSIWIKDLASKIVSVEESSNAVKDANVNLELNDNTDHIDIREGNADLILEELASSDQKFDIVLLDPPRKGCSQETLEQVVKMAQKAIIYVSCDPSTLARDVKYLKEKGFTPKYLQPVDMFCHTYHVESVMFLEKAGN